MKVWYSGVVFVRAGSLLTSTMGLCCPTKWVGNF